MDSHDNSTTVIILANSNSNVNLGICRVDFIHFYLSAKGDINFMKFKVRFSFSLDIVSGHDIYIYIYESSGMKFIHPLIRIERLYI
jgi:hypothetical protein